MSVGAGTRLLVGGYDLSKDATAFEAGLMKAIGETTGLVHKKRQREHLSLADDSFSMSAFWEPGTAAKVFPDGEEPWITHAYGLMPGAYALSFEGALSPSKTVSTPVGDFIQFSTEGNSNGPKRLTRMAFFSPSNTSYSRGGTLLDDSGVVEYSDALSKVRLLVHLVEPLILTNVDSAVLSLSHSADGSTGWAEIGTETRINLVTGGVAIGRSAMVSGEAEEAGLGRFVGLNLAITPNEGQVQGSFGAFIIGE